MASTKVNKEELEEQLKKEHKAQQEAKWKRLEPKEEDEECSPFEYFERLSKADALLDENRKSGTFPSQMMYVQAWKNDDEKHKSEEIPEPVEIKLINRKQVPLKYKKNDIIFVNYVALSTDGSSIVVRAIGNPEDRKALDENYMESYGQFHTEEMILAMSNDIAPFNGKYAGGTALIMSTYSPCLRCGAGELIEKICKKIKADKCIYFYGAIWKGSGTQDAPATSEKFYGLKKIGNIPIHQCFDSVMKIEAISAATVLYRKKGKRKMTKENKGTEARSEYHDIYSGHYMNGLSNQENNQNSKAVTMATDLFAGYGFDQYDGNNAYYQSKRDESRLAGNLLHGESSSSYTKFNNDFMESFSFGFICGILYMALLCCVVVILAYILGRAWNKIKRLFDSEQATDKDSDGLGYEV